MKITARNLVKLFLLCILIILTWYTSRYYYEDEQQPVRTIFITSIIKTFSSISPLHSLKTSLCPSLFFSSSSSPSYTFSTLKFEHKTNVIDAAVVLSLSKQSSHIAEFHLLYESWRFIQNFSPLSEEVIIDLIVFCEYPSCYQLPLSCLPLSYNEKLNLVADCFYTKLEDGIVNEWKNYLYMTSIAFMLTTEYQQSTINYKWILRVDQDAVLSPALLMGLARKHQVKLLNMQFGGIGHGIEFTHKRLQMIANKLGYNHSRIHNLCSTWLVTPKDSIKIANLTVYIGKYLLKNEFGQHVPGIEDLPSIGEWPKWWRGVTSLYAAEIAINHIYSSTLNHQHGLTVLDHPADSDKSLWDAWHIHCLHNAAYFSKFRHRDDLYYFLRHSQTKRIKIIKNYFSAERIIKEVMNEYYGMQMRNETFNGKITVRDYVTVLAWRKAYSATGAIDF